MLHKAYRFYVYVTSTSLDTVNVKEVYTRRYPYQGDTNREIFCGHVRVKLITIGKPEGVTWDADAPPPKLYDWLSGC